MKGYQNAEGKIAAPTVKNNNILFKSSPYMFQTQAILTILTKLYLLGIIPIL